MVALHKGATVCVFGRTFGMHILQRIILQCMLKSSTILGYYAYRPWPAH